MCGINLSVAWLLPKGILYFLKFRYLISVKSGMMTLLGIPGKAALYHFYFYFFCKITESSVWLKLPSLRVWIYLTSNHIPSSPLSAMFFSPVASCTFRWMWSCSQQLMQLPSELQYPLVSLSIATSFSLHAFIYCCAIQSSDREYILSCFSASGSKVRCSSTNSAYIVPVFLHSCPLFMPLSCLNQEHLAGNKGKGLWEGFHKQM